jgi:hypothetical protein
MPSAWKPIRLIVAAVVAIVSFASIVVAQPASETSPPEDAGPTLLPAPEVASPPPPPSAPVVAAPPAPGAAHPTISGPGPLADVRLIVGVERAFGGVAWRSTLSAAPAPATGDVRISWDREASSGHVTSLLGASASYGELSEVAAPSLLPRVAVDVVLAKRFTAGGAAGYFSSAGTHDVMTAPIATTARDPERHGLLLAPRVGYLLALGPHTALWLRAGGSFASTTVEQVDETDALITREVWHLTASLDPALVWSPVPHLGLLVNPFADVGVAGHRRVSVALANGAEGQNQAGYRWTGFGLALALCGLL